MSVDNKVASYLTCMWQKQDALRLITALKKYEATGNGDVKSLQGRNGYRLRLGDMRAIFEIIDGMIVLQAGYRGNILLKVR